MLERTKEKSSRAKSVECGDEAAVRNLILLN